MHVRFPTNEVRVEEQLAFKNRVEMVEKGCHSEKLPRFMINQVQFLVQADCAKEFLSYGPSSLFCLAGFRNQPKQNRNFHKADLFRKSIPGATVDGGIAA